MCKGNDDVFDAGTSPSVKCLSNLKRWQPYVTARSVWEPLNIGLVSQQTIYEQNEKKHNQLPAKVDWDAEPFDSYLTRY